MLETTCDDQKDKHVKSKKVWAEAEGEERTHRTERKEWMRENENRMRLEEKSWLAALQPQKEKKGFS